jgi:L-amino acid N-acyltransferase YncA
MISYQVEKWRDALPDMEPILRKHWHEIALDHEAVPLDIDYDKYQKMCDDGILHVLTARDDGRLIGYHVTIINPHLHYKSTLHAFTDVYFILPEYRKGFVGIRLFQVLKREMKTRGVKKLVTGTKVHLDMGKVFSYLGYRHTEQTHTLLI